MRRTLESPIRSHDTDVPKNPEGVPGYTYESYEDHMKEVKKFLSSLPIEKGNTIADNKQAVKEAREKVLGALGKGEGGNEEVNFEKYKTIWEREKAVADKSCLNRETGRYEKGYAVIPPEAMKFVEHRRELAQKQANGEEMTLAEKMQAGRDGIVYEWNGYKLKSDCCYRKISREALEQYQKSGFVDNNIDLKTISRKDGAKVKGRIDTVDWFLGATTSRYGDILIETPASEKYFVPVEKPGEPNMLTDTEAIHMHSSGIVDPIPMSEVRVIGEQ